MAGLIRYPYVVQDVTVLYRTDKAILVDAETFPEDAAWFPLSQIHPDSPVGPFSYPGDVADMVASRWILEQKQIPVTGLDRYQPGMMLRIHTDPPRRQAQVQSHTGRFFDLSQEED